MKLSARISLLTGVLLFALTIAIGFTAFMVSSRIIEAAARASLENQAVLGADLVEANINGQLRILREFASRSEALTMDIRNFAPSFNKNIDDAGFLDIALVGADGTAHYFKERTTAFLGDRDYVKGALAGRNTVSDVLISRVTGASVLMLGVPVYTGNGVVAGALIGRMDGNALTEITNNIKFGKTGYAYIINESGVFISHHNSELVTQQYNPIEAAKTDPKAEVLARAVRVMLDNKSGFLSYEFNGRDTYAGFVPVEGYAWKFVVVAEREELLAGITRLIIFIAGTGLVLLAAGIIMAILTGRSVSRPVGYAARALKDISEGEGDLTMRLDINSRDELGDLAGYFNKMLAKIEGLILVIKDRSLTLRQIGGGLT
ncbi:MAG: methyl-accepting chemotaxis protein, partial [Spirochaetaceae bacterium]|nr:methyl-accepting chemotaxis protein [Spirochaetaceae bacterium]